MDLFRRDALPLSTEASTPPAHAKKAVVLVPGFNCPIAWACMRFGQLLSLGNFGPDVLPLVFSWPGGKVFSYFHVKSRMEEFGPDFAAFIDELILNPLVREVHLLAHSMGSQ